MAISLIMAASKGTGVIGRDGSIPWRLSGDMKRFKELTTGHVVLMGRRTWQSLPERFRPLPDRGNIVLTTDSAFVAPGALVISDAEAAIRFARALTDESFVIGGAAMYDLFLPHASTVYLTEVDAEVDGDVRFPYRERLDPETWRLTARERVPADEHNQYPSTFLRMVRVRPDP